METKEDYTHKSQLNENLFILSSPLIFQTSF